MRGGLIGGGGGVRPRVAPARIGHPTWGGAPTDRERLSGLLLEANGYGRTDGLHPGPGGGGGTRPHKGQGCGDGGGRLMLSEYMGAPIDPKGMGSPIAPQDMGSPTAPRIYGMGSPTVPRDMESPTASQDMGYGVTHSPSNMVWGHPLPLGYRVTHCSRDME